MQQNSNHGMDKLLTDADRAIDPDTSGVLDRKDLQEMVVRLRSMIEQLAKRCEDLEAERDFFISRLTRLNAHDVQMEK